MPTAIQVFRLIRKEDGENPSTLQERIPTPESWRITEATVSSSHGVHFERINVPPGFDGPCTPVYKDNKGVSFILETTGGTTVEGKRVTIEGIPGIKTVGLDEGDTAVVSVGDENIERCLIRYSSGKEKK